MQRDGLDWGGNLVAFALVVVFNVLSNALPLNGQTMPEISAKYPSLFTPAGFAFSIWGLIYLFLLLFVIYQALPAQRSNAAIAAISPVFKINCVANAAWIVVWHYDLLLLSVILMLVILATLVTIYRSLLAQAEDIRAVSYVALHLPFSLYTGWITVATIANISVLQLVYGWDNVGLTAAQWALVKLAIAGAVGVTVLFRARDAVFALVVSWAAYGISVMQADTPTVSGAAMTVSLLTLMLAVSEVARRLRRN